jgi:hypothetical protein
VSICYLELASHQVLVANGAPAESHRDDGNRWLFQNRNAGWSQPPMPPCAPVLTGGPVVDAAAGACRVAPGSAVDQRAGPASAGGRHARGRQAENDFRWTNGDALLPASLFDGIDGRPTLELLVCGGMRYSLLAEAAAHDAA